MSIGAPRGRSDSEGGPVDFDFASKTSCWTGETRDKVKKAAGIIAVVAALIFAVLLTLALTVAATTFIALPLAIAAAAVAVIALIVYIIAYCIKPKDAEEDPLGVEEEDDNDKRQPSDTHTNSLLTDADNLISELENLGLDLNRIVAGEL
jgi:hypothetical protein